MSEFEPTINNLIEQTSLRWIFVGGKGGVGKTTCSCSIAIQLAKVRKNVLLLSTDPAHNLSDAFGQKFTKEPTLVNGFTNLSAVELDVKDVRIGGMLNPGQEELANQLQEMLGNVPGMDEALSFIEILRQLDNLSYDVIVFDTAPTGHTLRLLSLPHVLNNGIGKLLGWLRNYAPMLNNMASMVGMGQALGGTDIVGEVEKLKRLCERTQEQFTDPERTTFVCVCIAEFLSLYETERLIQELTSFDMDTHNIIVNQLVEKSNSDCELCDKRVQHQAKYLDQIADLYEDFNVTKLPLLTCEVRGPKQLEEFSERLKRPWSPKVK